MIGLHFSLRSKGIFGLAVCLVVASAIPVRAADDIAIGSPSVKYVDPEFDSANHRMTFQDGTTPGGSAWIGWLDPATGKLKTATGKDRQVGTGVTSIWRTLQGPEWIKDAGRSKVFFTATDGTHPNLYVTPALIGSPQLVFPADGYVRTSLSGSSSELDRSKLVYFRNLPGGGDMGVYWMDIASPGVENLVPAATFGGSATTPTWLGSRFLLYTKPWAGVSQLTLYDTALRNEVALTADEGDKSGQWSWEAPEFGGQRFYSCMAAGSTELRIYRRESPSDTYLTRFATLTAPPQAGNQIYINSPEPFIFQGRSYFSLALQDTPDNRQASARGSIWVWSLPLSPGGASAQSRVDGNLGVRPIDPETYVTADAAFVYYYHIINASQSDERVELRRCIFAP